MKDLGGGPGNWKDVSRNKLPLGIDYRLTRRDVAQIAKAAGETIRVVVENEAEIASERGYSIPAGFIDERVKEIETKIAGHLATHINGYLEEFLRDAVFLFKFEAQRRAWLAWLAEEGAEPAAMNFVTTLLVERERKLDQSVLGARRKLPRGAPHGKRKSTREKENRASAVYEAVKRTATQEGKRKGKSEILPKVAKLLRLPEGTVDAHKWPRRRKKKPSA